MRFKKSLILLLVIFLLNIRFNDRILNSIQYKIERVASDPPFNGDWVITDNLIINDELLVLNGSIVITKNITLTLSDVDIIFQGNAQSAENGSFNITILEGAELVIESGSEIATDSQDYYTWINMKAKSGIRITDSSLDNLGYGGDHPAIKMVNSSGYFMNCDITTSVDSFAAIAAYNASEIQIQGTTIISEGGIGVYSENISNLIIVDSRIQSEGIAISIRDHSNSSLKILENIVASSNASGIIISSKNPFSKIEAMIIANNTFPGTADNGLTICNYSNAYIFNNYFTNINTLANNHGSIHLVNSNNSTIFENYIYNSGDDGIVVQNTNDIVISSNIVSRDISSTNSAIGINMTNCNRSLITLNHLTALSGDAINYYSDNGHNVTISLNSIFGVNKNGINVDGLRDGEFNGNTIETLSGNGINVNNSSRFSIRNNKIVNSQSNGISIINCTEFNVSKSHIEASWNVGISLNDSDIFEVRENNIINNFDGVISTSSSFGNYFGNRVKETSRYAFFFSNTSYNNSVSKNIIYNNHYGIMCDSNYGVFTNNSIQYNSYGMFLSNGSFKNFVFFNDFINNGIQAIDYGLSNEWSSNISDSDRYLGNYWSDYTSEDIIFPYGFGDIPYSISIEIKDYFPLMKNVFQINYPQISQPADRNVTVDVVGSDGGLIIWWSYSPIPDIYSILVNEEEVYCSSWTDHFIVFNTLSLPVGTYLITCVLYDFLDNSVSASVKIIVHPTIKSTATTSTTNLETTVVSSSMTSENTTIQTSLAHILLTELGFIVISLVISIVVAVIIRGIKQEDLKE